MNENDVIYADDLTDFDENGNVIPSETSIRQAEFTEKLAKDITPLSIRDEFLLDAKSLATCPKIYKLCRNCIRYVHERR